MPDRQRKPQTETPHRDKLCKTCGRTFKWHKDLARDWDILRHCSDACRSLVPGSPEGAAKAAALEAAILSLLHDRSPQKTICPSEAAKLVGGTASLNAWQPLMEPARAAARRLVAQGRIVILQRGRLADPATAKGPIRLKLR